MINYLTQLIDEGYEVECSTKVLKDVPLLVLSVHKRVYLSESSYVKRGFTRTCIPISLLKATSESVRDRYVLNCLNAIIEQCNRECILLSDGDSHFNNWTPDDYNKYLENISDNKGVMYSWRYGYGVDTTNYIIDAKCKDGKVFSMMINSCSTEHTVINDIQFLVDWANAYVDYQMDKESENNE